MTAETLAAAQWDTELASLLEDLSAVQQELLDVLEQKRDRMAEGDLAGMAELQPQEEALGRRLEECHQRRTALLQRSQADGLPADNLGRLATMAPAGSRERINKQAKDVSARMRLLQHQSLVNWVVAQRSLLHLSQMLEIIATGGRFVPTYGNNESHQSRGSLVDEEV